MYGTPVAPPTGTTFSLGKCMASLASKILNWGFRQYVRRFVRKNFNAVRVTEQEQLAGLPDKPIVCFINHPGWWDPILERLGFFSVERDTASGAKEFLRTSRELLKDSKTILWLTPAGKFHDIRQPASFMNGLSHLVDSQFPGTALPMAIEYTFWKERCPELLVRFGSPVICAKLSIDRDARTLELEHTLTTTQAPLAELAIARNPAAFTTLAIGRAGIGGLYDFWRRMIAGLRGRSFQNRHSNEPVMSTNVVKGELT